jgi:autotransporter adhesin
MPVSHRSSTNAAIGSSSSSSIILPVGGSAAEKAVVVTGGCGGESARATASDENLGRAAWLSVELQEELNKSQAETEQVSTCRRRRVMVPGEACGRSPSPSDVGLILIMRTLVLMLASQVASASEQSKRRLDATASQASALQERVNLLMAATAAALGETATPTVPTGATAGATATVPTTTTAAAGRWDAPVYAPGPMVTASLPSANTAATNGATNGAIMVDDDADQWDVSEEPGPMYSSPGAGF